MRDGRERKENRERNVKKQEDINYGRGWRETGRRREQKGKKTRKTCVK